MSTFGCARLAEFPLDPNITYLNHGTVGVTPRRVTEAQRRIEDEIERRPSQFLLRELTGVIVGQPQGSKPRLRQAADAIAGFFGTRGDDLVFVDNATTGANAVVRSLPLAQGDEILVTDHGYGGVTNAALFAAREHGATVRTATLPDPIRSAEAVMSALLAAVRPSTRLAIVDHITAHSAVILPIAELAREFHKRGIALLVDGAHAPGAIALDIPALGADWYVGNLHKWMWVPRSSGILWASPERQKDVHPLVTSWGLDQGFAMEFDLPGTRNPSSHLSAPAALAFMQEIGVDEVRRYNHQLAWEGARLLANRFETEFAVPEQMIGTLATVTLPPHLGSTDEEAARLRDRLLFEDRIEVQVHAWQNRLQVRISAQIYNDLEDVERLASAVLRP